MWNKFAMQYVYVTYTGLPCVFHCVACVDVVRQKCTFCVCLYAPDHCARGMWIVCCPQSLRITRFHYFHVFLFFSVLFLTKCMTWFATSPLIELNYLLMERIFILIHKVRLYMANVFMFHFFYQRLFVILTLFFVSFFRFEVNCSSRFLQCFYYSLFNTSNTKW